MKGFIRLPLLRRRDEEFKFMQGLLNIDEIQLIIEKDIAGKDTGIFVKEIDGILQTTLSVAEIVALIEEAQK